MQAHLQLLLSTNRLLRANDAEVGSISGGAVLAVIPSAGHSRSVLSYSVYLVTAHGDGLLNQAILEVMLQHACAAGLPFVESGDRRNEPEKLLVVLLVAASRAWAAVGDRRTGTISGHELSAQLTVFWSLLVPGEWSGFLKFSSPTPPTSRAGDDGEAQGTAGARAAALAGDHHGVRVGRVTHRRRGRTPCSMCQWQVGPRLTRGSAALQVSTSETVTDSEMESKSACSAL